VALVVDTLGFLAAHVGDPQGNAFLLRVHTEDPERDLALRVEDAVELTDWEAGAPDSELRIPAEGFVRLIYGRLDVRHTPRVELTGPISLEDLRRMFPGV
ncbi:MAG: hypothetical protein ACJ8F7_05665, partial [Gemmataceae bacterium]